MKRYIYLVAAFILLYLAVSAIPSGVDVSYESKTILYLEGWDGSYGAPAPRDYTNANAPATYPEVGYDYDYVTRVVMAEAGAASLECQLLVAQCIQNSATGLKNPEDVVKADGAYTEPYEGTVSASVKEACRRVFLDHENVADKPIKYFYTDRWGLYSEWHEAKEYYKTVDDVRFFA